MPAGDQPVDYNALSDLKLTAVGNGGTAGGFFDSYALDAPTGTTKGSSLAADELVHRNSIIDGHVYDTPSFKIFPSVELGVGRHANRFDFGITSPSQFVLYQQGVDGILPTQQSGYPAQLNHPGESGGVTDTEATTTNAKGADLMEVRQQGMIDIWDSILREGVSLPPVGTWGTDIHSGTWSAGSQATFIRAPALDFDALMKALYEGRAYNGAANFSSGLALNLEPGSAEPYPARYPVHVPTTQTSAPVHLAIAGGLRAGQSGRDSIRWLSNGDSAAATSTIATETASSATYDATKSIPLGGSSTYVRAEVRDPAGKLRAMSQPIFFKRVAGLPDGYSYHVDDVATPDGKNYTKQATKGITASSWDGATSSLSLTLTDPARSLVSLLGSAPQAPQELTVDGAAVAAAGSLAAWRATTGSSWHYDSATRTLYVKALHADTTAAVKVRFAAGPADTQPPTAPANPRPTGTTQTSVSVAWDSSTDDVGVDHYNVYDGTTLVGSATGTTFTVSGLTCGSTHSFGVEAVDTAGNVSPRTTVDAPTTRCGGGTTTTFKSVADAHVDASVATRNFGASSKLRVDASPDVRSYLRFTISGLTGTVTRATLRVFADSSLAAGYDVRGSPTTPGRRPESRTRTRRPSARRWWGRPARRRPARGPAWTSRRSSLATASCRWR